ncbi:Uncharacterised protein [Mycobacteroides abscessus subsp. abscessus]|nr:Uncharacterised protein [Mycobacteroides abscessus subsp. abscessus]
MLGQRVGREPVGQDEADVGRGFRDVHGRGRQPAQIGTAQILATRLGLAAHHSRFADPDLPDAGREGLDVERLVHGIARGGVGRGQFEDLTSGQRVTGAAQPDAGLRGLAELVPKLLDGKVFGHRHPAAVSARSAERCRSNLVSLPASSVMPTFLSQASNSGAGFRPSVRRTATTSWNDRLW